MATAATQPNFPTLDHALTQMYGLRRRPRFRVRPQFAAAALGQPAAPAPGVTVGGHQQVGPAMLGAAPAAPAPPAATAPVAPAATPNLNTGAAGYAPPPGMASGGAPAGTSPMDKLFAGQHGTSNATGMANDLIHQGQAAGAFGPDFLRDRAREAAIREHDALTRRRDVLSQLLGLDPSQAAVAYGNAESEANQAGGNMVANAELQGADQWVNFIRSLFGNQISAEQAQKLAQQASASQDRGTFGQILGAAIGAVPKLGL